MKKSVHFLNYLIIVVAFVLATSITNAAIRTASVPGPWNSTVTWGGASVPTSADDVTINAGVTVTVTSAAACNSLVVNGTLSVSTANITMADGGSVTVNNGGHITFSSTNVITGGGNGSNGIAITIQSGANLTTANVLGFTTSASNNITLTGSFNVNKGNRTISYSTSANYTYNANAAQVTGNGITGAANLTLSGSGNKTLSNSINLSGTLSLRGTAVLINSPTYGAASTLEYAGSSAQTTGVEFPNTGGPFNLRINNANGVTLNAARSINGNLSMTSGVLTTTTTNILTISNGGTTSGASNSSYVNGPIRKNGNQAFTFPIGKNGIYSPLTIGAPDNVADVFEAEYMRSSGTALGSLGSGLYGVSNCEYWQLNEINNAGASNSISVNVSWGSSSGCGGSGYVTDLTGIVLAHFDGSTWSSLGGTAGGNPTTGSITAANVTNFSPFTFGNILPNANPLPVKFSSIKAFEKQSGIQIDWIAYQEDNVDIYQVEHSADGIVFAPIGTVSSRNSSVETTYSFFDASPLPGVNFYRLRNVDFDGKSGYSNIVKVNLDKSVKNISFYPNPVRGEFVSLQSSDLAKGNYSVRVMNSAGQQVYTQRFNHTGGAINQTIHLPVGMQSGIYILQLDKEATKVISKTFVVQK